MLKTMCPSRWPLLFRFTGILLCYRYWSVIDNAIREAAYDRGVQVQMLMSNWSHSKKEMFPMLRSLQDFGKACKKGNITVVSFGVSLSNFTIEIFLG